MLGFCVNECYLSGTIVFTLSSQNENVFILWICLYLQHSLLRSVPFCQCVILWRLFASISCLDEWSERVCYENHITKSTNNQIKTEGSDILNPCSLQSPTSAKHHVISWHSQYSYHSPKINTTPKKLKNKQNDFI